MAQLTRSTYAAVSVDEVLGIGGFDASRVDEQVKCSRTHGQQTHASMQLLRTEEEHEHEHEHHEHEHEHEHEEPHNHEHHHNDSITSVSIEVDGDVDLERINRMLTAILDFRGEDIFRMKGIVSIRGWKERFVFQV